MRASRCRSTCRSFLAFTPVSFASPTRAACWCDPASACDGRSDLDLLYIACLGASVLPQRIAVALPGQLEIRQHLAHPWRAPHRIEKPVPREHRITGQPPADRLLEP